MRLGITGATDEGGLAIRRCLGRACASLRSHHEISSRAREGRLFQGLGLMRCPVRMSSQLACWHEPIDLVPLRQGLSARSALRPRGDRGKSPQP